MPKEEWPFPCVTAGILFFHHCCLLMCGVMGAIIAIFSEIQDYVWPLIAQVTGVLLLFFLVIGLLAGLLQCCFKIWKIERLKAARISMMIGFSLIFILATVPRVFAFFILDSPALLYYVLYVLPLSATLIFALFNYPIVTLYKFDLHRKYGRQQPIMYTAAFFTFVCLVPAVRFSQFFPKEQADFFVLTHLTYWLLTMPLTIELAMVVTGKLVLREPKDGNETVQRPSETVLIEPAVETDPRLECKICLLPFSEFTRIPRILNNCGHTVCEACAKNLLRNNNNMHLFCPFCQTITVLQVQGFVDLLKKNHVTLEYIKELKRN